MNTIINNQNNSTVQDQLGPNSAVTNFVNSTNITRVAKKGETLASKIGIDIQKREQAKKEQMEEKQKMDERGPLGFKSGEAPEYIKDKVARETGKTFSDETDYIIHHPGDKLFYLRRKTGDEKAPNEYLNFTISDSEIDATTKPTTVRGIYMTEQISAQQETDQKMNSNETKPTPTVEIVEPINEVDESDRLASRKNILSRIAEQYRTQEDKDELARIETILQGTSNSELKDSTVTDGTLGTITIPSVTTNTVELVQESTVSAPIPAIQPKSPKIVERAPESTEPMTPAAMEDVTETQPITFESPEIVEDIKPELSLIQSASSVADIHNALEKMDGIETLTSHVGFEEAWDKTKKFMAGEITKAELPDNDEFLEKLITLKKAHDDELALLGISAKSIELKDTPEESEDVTEIIKPRHIISGKDVKITDDQDELTKGLSQSEIDRFNLMFGNIAPAKKVELTAAVSVPLQVGSALNSTEPTESNNGIEKTSNPEKKINRGKLTKKYQNELRKIFNIGNHVIEMTKPMSVDFPAIPLNQNDTMTSIGKKSPEALFN